MLDTTQNITVQAEDSEREEESVIVGFGRKYGENSYNNQPAQVLANVKDVMEIFGVTALAITTVVDILDHLDE